MRTQYFLLLFCLICLGLNSCTNKKEAEDQTGSQNPTKEFRLWLTKLNEGDQKIIFDGLPSQVKYDLWKDRLSEALEMPLESKQKELVQQMAEQLSPAVFDSVNGPKPLVTEWWASAKEIFINADTTKLQNIFMQLGDSNKAKPLLFQQQAQKDCNCEMGATINCPINFTCKIKPCRVNRCGLFWAWKCDGMCI